MSGQRKSGQARSSGQVRGLVISDPTNRPDGHTINHSDEDLVDSPGETFGQLVCRTASRAMYLFKGRYLGMYDMLQ